MPNGGADNCGTCGFNRRNRGIWGNPTPDESQMPFCEIRNVMVPADLWTYCRNWHTRSRQPIGPVYTSGLYEQSYQRIPWHGSIEPQMGLSGICSECGAGFSDGILIPAAERSPLQFCCNQHYMQWWRKQHPDEDASMSNESEHE
jgi:hypothetical protein